MKKLVFLLFSICMLIGCSNAETKKSIANAHSLPYSNPPKTKIFHDVTGLKGLLIKNSTLFFTDWTKNKFVDGSEKWTSHTPLEQFGTHSNNGFKNDIHYHLLGKDEGFVNEVRIVLNIKNSDDKKQAKETLSLWTQQTFANLAMDAPEGLLRSIKKGNEFYAETPDNYIYLKKVKKEEINGNIHPEKELAAKIEYLRWSVVIKSK